jgi:hypothetical protein
MKTLSSLALALFIAGCASTATNDTTKYSTATVSNVQSEEIDNLSNREHEFKVTFDYAIEDYEAGVNKYTCSVQFANTDGTSTTKFVGGRYPCRLDSAQGTVTVEWPSPLDKDVILTKKEALKLKVPIEYFVAVHQKSGRYSTKIIGKSASMLSQANVIR